MFTIGAFSRLAQLSIRVLRHYDEIGLLKPATTKRDTGYRYYTAEQLASVHRIVAFKELGLSLKQIEHLMRQKQHSLEEVAGMLHLERARAELERDDAERRLRDLDRRLSELSDFGRLSEIDIVEKAVPATPYLAYRTVVPDFDAAYALMREVVARCEPLGPWSPLTAVAHDGFFDTQSLDIELGYPVAHAEPVDLGAGRQLRSRELEAVPRMIAVVYLGSQEEGHRSSHSAIALWLERHRCELIGPGRELVHGPSDAARQTIEIQYPVASLPIP